MNQGSAFGQVATRYIRVIAENRGTDDDDEVVAGEFVAERSNGRRQFAGVERVRFRERCALAEWCLPHGRSNAFGKANTLGPGIGTGSGDIAAIDEDRIAGGVDFVCEGFERIGIGALACGDASDGHIERHFLIPVVERQGKKYRSGRFLNCCGIGAEKCARYVFGARRLVRPLYPGLGQLGGVDVGEERFHQQHVARLLPSGKNERGFVQIGRENVAHGIAQAGAGMHVNDDGLAQALR